MDAQLLRANFFIIIIIIILGGGGGVLIMLTLINQYSMCAHMLLK